MSSQGQSDANPQASSTNERVAGELASFRQGEVLDVPYLIYKVVMRGMPRLPLLVARSLTVLSRSKIKQIAILTQTCDIVRSPDKRPYLQASPLRRFSDINTVRRYAEGETPQYVALPGAGMDAFVDLDEIATISKTLAVEWPHHPGVREDPEEIRRFGQGVARKFGRYPFPNYFIESVDLLRKRILHRWDKSTSPEGRVLADLVQIRVRPVPIEGASATDFSLSFIMKQGSLPILDNPPSPSRQITSWLSASRGPADIAQKIANPSISLDDKAFLYDRLAESWADQCSTNHVVRSISGEIVSEDEYVLTEYWQSERLDLDQLSGPVTSG